MADTDFDRHPHGHCPKHCAECGEDAKATLCPRCSDLAKADMCIRCRTEPALPCTLMCDGCWTKAQQRDAAAVNGSVPGGLEPST